MLAPAHRQAAEGIERGITALHGTPGNERLGIGGAWGSAFHWIAFGCETKHGRYQESHARLGALLRTQGEAGIAGWWDQMERLRQGGWYGQRTDPASVGQALELLREIRTWATS